VLEQNIDRVAGGHRKSPQRAVRRRDSIGVD
jgi:hypothetical protein